MEPFEVVNRLLMPADRVVGAAVDTLDYFGAYEPMRAAGYELGRSSLERLYRLMHDLEVIGRDNIPEGGCIITPNHASWLDVEMVAVAARRRVNFVAKSEFRHWPLLRQLIRVTDAIYVRRGGDPTALDEICDAVSAGKAVVMFPEGTIPGEEDIPRWEVEPDTHLLRGRSGAVRVALRTGAPIIPCGVSGTGRAFPPEAWPRMQVMPPLLRSEPVSVRFGSPIHFTAEGQLTREQLAVMTRRLMLTISSLIDHERNRPADLPPVSPGAQSRLPAMASSRNLNEAELPRKVPCGLLLLHGSPSYHEALDVFAPMLVRLDVPHRVPILSGPGARSDSTSPSQWAEDAACALDDLLRYAERAVVVGISTGALVALELAARHRDSIAGVVAISTPAPSFATTIRGKLHRLQPDLAYAREVSNLLSFVKAPLLMLHSKSDEHSSAAAARRLRSRASSSSRVLTMLRGRGSSVFEGPDRQVALREVESFVSRIIDELAEDAAPASAEQRAAG